MVDLVQDSTSCVISSILSALFAKACLSENLDHNGKVYISGNSIWPYLEWEPEQSPLFVLSRDGRPGTRQYQL